MLKAPHWSTIQPCRRPADARPGPELPDDARQHAPVKVADLDPRLVSGLVGAGLGGAGVYGMGKLRDRGQASGA